MAPRSIVAGRLYHGLHSGQACSVRPAQRQACEPAGPHWCRHGRPDQAVPVVRRLRSSRSCRLLGQPRPHAGLH
eukprot:5287785-Alexandrium_andersonii.AAC.1